MSASWPDLPGTGEPSRGQVPGAEARHGRKKRAQRRFPLPVAPVGPTPGPGRLHRRAGRAGSDRAPGDRTAPARLCGTSGQPPWLPRLPTSVILGDAPISDYLETRIEALIPGPDQEPAPVETDSAGFTERVR